MKEHGILHYKHGDLEITLHPDALAKDPETKPDLTPELDNKQRGKSGMTRKEQYDLFGVVAESEFK